MHPLAKTAVTAVRAIATNPATQKQLQKLALKRAGTIANSKLSDAQKQRAQRGLAIEMARQIEGGQLSFGTLIDGRPHTVVWADATPIQAFPDCKGNLEEKLRRHRRDLLVDPLQKRSAGSRLPWNRGGRPDEADVDHGAQSASLSDAEKDDSTPPSGATQNTEIPSGSSAQSNPPT